MLLFALILPPNRAAFAAIGISFEPKPNATQFAPEGKLSTMAFMLVVLHLAFAIKRY